MTIDRGLDARKQTSSFQRTSVLIGVALAMGLATLPAGRSTGQQDGRPDRAKRGKTPGIVLSDDATAQDVGLPIYPGAQRLKETSDDSSALQLGMWGRSGGFKLVVLKLESGDSPGKIADFYRKALSTYGPILDCTKASTHSEKPVAESNKLDCEDDAPVAGGFLLKAGSKDKQHLVAVEREKGRSKIALIYIENPS
jgi:hypothetical protein